MTRKLCDFNMSQCKLTVLFLRRRRFWRGHPGAPLAARLAAAPAGAAEVAPPVVDLVHHVVVRGLGLVAVRVRVAAAQYRRGNALGICQSE